MMVDLGCNKKKLQIHIRDTQGKHVLLKDLWNIQLAESKETSLEVVVEVIRKHGKFYNFFYRLKKKYNILIKCHF